MMRKCDAHPEEIARLFGVRAVTASEIGVGKTWNTGRLKDFSGGDRLTGHLMRQNSITFYPQFKITFAGNNQPRLPEIDDAIRRRLILVPFTQKPKQLDPTLKGPNSRLVAEYPGILAWMIRGENRRSTAGGLDKLIPGIASQATATYLDEQDQIKNWAKERCVFGPRERVSVRQAYEDYKAWCYAQGGSPVNTSIHDFCTKFLVRFQNCTKRDYNDHRTPVGFEGVGLTPQDGGVAGVAGF
jgi:putative DNA primase/helicase